MQVVQVDVSWTEKSQGLASYISPSPPSVVIVLNPSARPPQHGIVGHLNAAYGPAASTDSLETAVTVVDGKPGFDVDVVVLSGMRVRDSDVADTAVLQLHRRRARPNLAVDRCIDISNKIISPTVSERLKVEGMQARARGEAILMGS